MAEQMVQERKKITIILRIISREEIPSSRHYECFSTCVPQKTLPKKKQRGLSLQYRHSVLPAKRKKLPSECS